MPKAFNLKNNGIRPNLRKLCQNSDVLNSKIRSSRLNTHQINLKVDKFTNSRNFGTKNHSVPLKHPYSRNVKGFNLLNMRNKNQVLDFKTVDFALIPTMINLKEITDLHGKSFAKFKMRFNRPKEL